MPGRRSVIVALVGGLAGCGFELKRAPEFAFKSIRLAGFAPRSPLEIELRERIETSPSTVVVDNPAQAQVTLQALTDVREKRVVASTAAGQVTEFQLRLRFGFRLVNAAGKELMRPPELLQTRDLSYTESAALGKEQEEASLYRSMQSDVVSQVMRRLESVKEL